MPNRDHIKLSDLTKKIRAVIEHSFGNERYWVVADIVDYNFYPSSKWHYFGLIEKQASLIVAKAKAVAPPDAFDAINNFERQTGQKFGSGITVLINVYVTYHAEYGLQLSLIDIDASYTLGQIAQQKEATIQRLLSECSSFVELRNGLFFTNNKALTLGPVIQKIALVSSHNARGYEDFRTTIEENKYGYKLSLDIYYSAVQGENNANVLFNTLLKVFNSDKQYDAVVIVRGGGGDTDFLIFDHYDVARIIAKFPIPIIVGIGHHINETITDLMAHTSTKTPSIAAEFILAHNKRFEDQLIAFGNRVSVRSLQAISNKQDKLLPAKAMLAESANAVLRAEERRLNGPANTVMNKSRQMLSRQHNSLEDQLARILTRPLVIMANSRSTLSQLNSSFINNSRASLRKKNEALAQVVHVTKAASEKILYKQQSQLSDTMRRISSRSLSPLQPNRKQLELQAERIKLYTNSYLSKNSRELSGLESLCRVMSPVNILKKGFAIVYGNDRIVADGDRINPGDKLKIRFSHTLLEATVTSKTKTSGNEFDI